MFCGSFSSYWKSLPIQCKILFCEDVLNFVPKVPEKLNNSLKEELLSQTATCALPTINKRKHNTKKSYKCFWVWCCQSIALRLNVKRLEDQGAATDNGIPQAWKESPPT